MSEPVVDFLQPFPAEIVTTARAAVDAGAATVILEQTEVREFLRHPVAALGLVSDELDRLTAARPRGAAVVWCYRGDAVHGLDVDELAAVLGRRLHFNSIGSVLLDGERRAVAVATLREERVGVGVVLGDDVNTDDALALLTQLAGAALSSLVLFISADRLRVTPPPSPLGVALARFCAAGGLLGLWVREQARQAAMADPQSQVAPWSAFGLAGPLFVRFERGHSLQATEVDAFMRATGIRLDTSMPIDDGAAPAGSITRAAAYTGGSPYRPQPFDLRVPWFRCEASMWLELPAHESSAETVAAWWAERAGPPDEDLALLLDVDRREAYDRHSRVLPEETRNYAEFRVYNWPSVPPAVRGSLLLASANDAPAVLNGISSLAAHIGPSVQLVDAPTLYRTAVAEVVDRFDTSAERAMLLQADAHEYLRHIPFDAPLRQDYAEFARFVPAALGQTLEIGSGYGVLAWTLAPRATQYLCIDLDLRMFGAMRRDLGQHGLVADMQQLPLADGCIDAVVANNVIEHLYDPLAGLVEIRRVLSQDGRVFALLPLDALDSRHELPAHHWKIDADGITPAFAAAGFDITRIDIVDLYELGVQGAFPSCHGLIAFVEARRVEAVVTTRVEPVRATFRKQINLSGRLLPAVRESVRFEQLSNRCVVAIEPETADEQEFVHYGARVVRAGAIPWALQDHSVDLVYAFLTVAPSVAEQVVAETRRVLAPGGRVVMAFRNREGLQYRAGVRSYYGGACDLESLGLDTLSSLAAGARKDDEFVTRAWLAGLGGGFRTSTIRCTNLAVEDLRGWSGPEYPSDFWRWLTGTAGRFLVLEADR
jgi:SAM-dependent methyltransferase